MSSKMHLTRARQFTCPFVCFFVLFFCIFFSKNYEDIVKICFSQLTIRFQETNFFFRYKTTDLVKQKSSHYQIETSFLRVKSFLNYNWPILSMCLKLLKLRQIYHFCPKFSTNRNLFHKFGCSTIHTNSLLVMETRMLKSGQLR